MRFCFFGDISCAIKGKTIGGGELQVFLLAKALALKGHEVIIIDPYSNESFVTHEGIKLITVPNWNKGMKGVRLFQYHIPALWRIFSEQKADYYYVRMRSYLHLIPYLVARRTGGKFISAVASDLDVATFSKKYKYDYVANFNLFKYLTDYLPNDLVFNYLFKKSDYVTLQHCGQGSTSGSSKSNQVIVANTIDLSNLYIVNNPSKGYLIYVGSLTMLKGVERLYKLINTIDESILVVIVGSPKGQKSKEIYNKLSTKRNVILKGQQDHRKTIELISNAKAIINTSYFEGFPNIFLEAWGSGVPVISLTVNPGDIFNKYELGVCCNSDLVEMKLFIENNEMERFRQKYFKSIC